MPSPKKASPVQVANAVKVLYASGNMSLTQAKKILVNNARPTWNGGNPFSTAATRNRAKNIVNVYGRPPMGGGYNFRMK